MRRLLLMPLPVEFKAFGIHKRGAGLFYGQPIESGLPSPSPSTVSVQFIVQWLQGREACALECIYWLRPCLLESIADLL